MHQSKLYDHQEVEPWNVPNKSTLLKGLAEGIMHASKLFKMAKGEDTPPWPI